MQADMWPAKAPVVVAFGAGVNSGGVLAGMYERGIVPDLITFGDTGGERKKTYEFRDAVSEWCRRVGFPEVVTVRKGGRPETLEEKCLRNKTLPSIAFGFKTCSQAFKRQPQDVYVNNWGPALAAWWTGGKVVKVLGFDADEERRAVVREDEKYIYSYPLIEWGWDREDCVAAMARVAMPSAGKSSCWFCPSMRVHEIHELRDAEPELFARALAMEANAELTSVKGLGRRFAWRDHAVGGPLAGIAVVPAASIERPCGCFE
jgi:hypothetical protein